MSKSLSFFTALLAGLSLVIPLAGASETGKPASAAKQASPAKPRAAAKSSNPIANEAARKGVINCKKRIEDVTGAFAKSGSAGAFLFTPQQDANGHVFSTSMEIVTPTSIGYVSANFSPAGRFGCDASYDAVTYWNVSCAQTAALAFPKIKPAGYIKQAIQILDGGPNLRVFLMPAGQGCVAVKKEVLSD